MKSLARILVILVAVLGNGICEARQCCVRPDTSTWRLLADAGFYPTQGHVGVGWYPSYTVRAAVGRHDPTLSAYVCVDYYNFKLSESGGMYGYIEQSAERHDIAIYPALSLMRVLFLGAGLFYTHSDQVTTTSYRGKERWTGGNVEGVRFFWTVGLTWDIQLTANISLPFGLYYRNPGYNSATTPLAVRAGISASIR